MGNNLDKCCGRAGTHEELKMFYELPMTNTPKGSFAGKDRVLSTSMFEDELVPFSEKQVQAHGWLNILRITDDV